VIALLKMPERHIELFKKYMNKTYCEDMSCFNCILWIQGEKHGKDFCGKVTVESKEVVEGGVDGSNSTRKI